jgi:hypothetical protein
VPTSLKIEYQDAGGAGGPWQPVDLRTAAGASPTQASGQANFQPTSVSRTINLRAEVADAAGNVAYFSQQLSLLPPQPKAAEGIAQTPAADPSATRWPSEGIPTERGGQGLLASGGADSRSSTAEQVHIPGADNVEPSSPGRLASSASPTPAIADQLPLPQPITPTLTPAQDAPPRAPSPEPRAPHPELMPPPRPTEPIETPSGERPRLTNSRRFSLDYDVQSVGPEGAAAVELWGTADGGRTWIKWGADPDRTSPFDVEVSREATYGFRIVIVGKNGLATSTPQPGDAADIWVGVDLTRPTGRLTGAAYGQGEAAGKLDIRWEADDAHLGSRPVTLAISDRSDGAFTPIAVALPNTGQYLWEYDPRSPRQIYLRLEVRDDAGNVTIDQLNEPIKVEGLEPKGRIRGFVPGPEGQRGAAGSRAYR